jgi:hypothetical protein
MIEAGVLTFIILSALTTTAFCIAKHCTKIHQEEKDEIGIEKLIKETKRAKETTHQLLHPEKKKELSKEEIEKLYSEIEEFMSKALEQPKIDNIDNIELKNIETKLNLIINAQKSETHPEKQYPMEIITDWQKTIECLKEIEKATTPSATPEPSINDSNSIGNSVLTTGSCGYTR